jgi:VWFA-related protein
MPRSVETWFARRSTLVLRPFLLAALLISFLSTSSLPAQAPSDPNSTPPKTESSGPQSSHPAAPSQTPAPAATSAAPASTAPADASSSSEVSSHDTPPTFKVRVNLVLVHVVVRDGQGNVVPNLKKEDFQLFDNRKPQTILSFSVDTPESHAVTPSTPEKTETESPSADVAATAPHPALPQRFVALVFDDTNMQSTDALSVRDAASRVLSSLAPSDRVAMYSTSGQVTQDFTSDRAALQQTVLGVVPRPLATAVGIHDCPEVGYYQADQIVNFHDSQALAVATEDALQCGFNGDQTKRPQAELLAQSVAQQASSRGDVQTEFVYRHLEEAIRRLAGMPGQRVMVFVSPGFILTKQTREGGDLIDRANRSNIVINTIDARGLYTPDVLGDISDPPHDSYKTAGFKASYRVSTQFAQSEILGQLADGTGGTEFKNRNDLDRGLRDAVTAPVASYLLAFSPQNLKIDGRYHTLKVSLAGKQKYAVQARHGYYAPLHIVDPVEAAKEEIQEAIFSQEEMRDLPIDLQTQYFKPEQTQARLSVLTHVDVKGIPFRKLEGRNRDDLTIATAIFDDNGNFVTGGEKIVQMRLLEPTFARLSRSGFTVKSTFDIKPGTYLVRLVVRDAEGSQMAARNGAVVIPY